MKTSELEEKLRQLGLLEHQLRDAMALIHQRDEARENRIRLDENDTIHRWVQRPQGYDDMTALEQTKWVIMTLGKIGSWLDNRQVQLTNPEKGNSNG